MAGKKTSDAVKILDRLIGRDRGLKTLIERETVHAQVARIIYEARTRAGMTQASLARRIGTTQSVIARLEDADYEGHSLTALKRIAASLGRRVDIRLVPLSKRPKPAIPA